MEKRKAFIQPCQEALAKFCDDWHEKVKAGTGDERAATTTLLTVLSNTLALLSVEMKSEELMLEVFRRNIERYKSGRDSN